MGGNKYLSLDNSKPFSLNLTVQWSDSAEARTAWGTQTGILKQDRMSDLANADAAQEVPYSPGSANVALSGLCGKRQHRVQNLEGD